MLNKLFNTNWVIALIIFPFLNPTVFKFIPQTVLFYNSIQLIKALIIVFLLLSYILNGKFSKGFFLVSFFLFIMIATSVINGAFDIELITDSLLIYGFYILAEFGITINKDRFLSTSFVVCFILGLINFVLIILYPNGLMEFATLYTQVANPHYFLAIDNGMLKALCPLLVLALYYVFEDKKVSRNFFAFVAIVIIGLTLYLIKTSTGLLVYIIAILLYLFSHMIRKKIPSFLFLTIYAVFMITVVISGVKLQIVESITSLFGKSSTFTGRTVLWQCAIQLIEYSPLIGYGYGQATINVWGGEYSSHNLLLELSLHGGIILSGFFIVVIYLAFKHVKKLETRTQNIVIIGIITLLLNGMMESGLNPFIFALISVCFIKDHKKNHIKIKDYLPIEVI